MSQIQKNEVSNYIEEDEINLNELFSKIWRRKKFIVGFVILSMVSVAGIIAFKYLLIPPVTDYSETIRFNFSSSIQGTYPSGQRFSKNDLITTSVLKKVYDINNIKSYKIPFDNFASSFSVAPYAVNAAFIKAKYKKLLADRKLSTVELATLNEQYLSEIKAAQANFAKVTYVNSKHLGLSSLVIKKALMDIPKVWSSISIKDLGVLDLKIPGEQFYQPNLVKNYEYLQAVKYMLDSTKRFKGILDKLQHDEIGGFIKDPKTGLVVSDISARLININNFELNPMFSIISSLGLVKNKQKATLYLQNEIQSINDKISGLSRKAKVYSGALKSYAIQSKGHSTNRGISASAGNGGMVQYGDGFLSKVIGMVEAQKDTVFRQSLLSKQIEFALEAQTQYSDLEKMKRALKVLDTNNNNSLVKNYATQILNINQSLVKLLDAYQRILTVRNAQVLGKNSSLYELTSDSMNVVSDISQKAKKIALISALSGLLALMLAMFIALMVNEKSERGKGSYQAK